MMSKWKGTRMMKRGLGIGMMALSMAAAAANAQGGAAEAAPAAGGGGGETRRVFDLCSVPNVGAVKTYVLKNAAQPNDGNEIMTGLRNMLPPPAKVFYVASQSTLYVCATPELQALTERMVRELDKPRNRYKLTYTFTETDGGKRVGTQHFSMLV